MTDKPLAVRSTEPLGFAAVTGFNMTGWRAHHHR